MGDDSLMSEQRICKTFKYKLEPTPAQAQRLDETLSHCRDLYNAAIGERREAWRMRGISVTYFQQKAELPGIKEALPEFRDVHSQVLQDVILRAERAFRRFFHRVRDNKAPRYPRFQGPYRYANITFPQFGNGVHLDNGNLVLSKIGRIRMRLSRPLAGLPKTATIRREIDGWYVCIVCAELPIQPLPETGKVTGVDLGLKVFLICADGSQTANPRYYRKAEKALKKAHKRVSRRKRGSKRRAKAARCLGKKYAKVSRQRTDHHHKTARALVRMYDTIYYENLQVANLLHNKYLAKSIADAAWSQFCTILVFKAACAGKRATSVAPKNTTQQCSNPKCKKIVPKGLSVRWHRCPHCGTVFDRDENAARNILHIGLEAEMQRLGQSLRGVEA